MRPIPSSLINKFGNIIVNQDWSLLEHSMSTTDMVEVFENITGNMVRNVFPEKLVTISDYDKPYITEELKSLRRQRQRAYRKGGKNAKYLEIKSKFDNKLKAEAEKYRLKILAEVAEGKRGNAYGALRKLEFGKNNEKSKQFTLPSHAEQNLSTFQSAEKLADYFSQISQQFDPICTENLPPWIQEELLDGRDDPRKPVLEEYEVYRKLNKSKKPNSVIPGDIPVKLVKEFTPELTVPITRIYNRITKTGEYPRQWVTEYQLAIPKVHPPLTEDDTRNIASTSFFSKQYESFLGDWIFPYIEPYLDPGQCGGLRGSSITHYLVKLLHFVHGYLDLKQPHAVLLVLVDLEKAFNRVSHQQVIEDLADMHVPGWLLLLLVSYLTGRSMFMRYKGAASSRKLLPGSSPQGAFLGILIFIIIFNGALLRPAIPRLHSLNLKYIDDLSMLAAFNLRKCLERDPVNRPRPLQYSERTQQILPLKVNHLQEDLDYLVKYTQKKQLKIKESKTEIMKFNFCTSFDFPPDLIVDGFNELVKVTKETKLLGIIVTEDLKWEANTNFICSKAYRRMWTLRRMKILNVDPYIMLDVYKKEIRSILELAVPAWHSGLTKKQSATIERVQKVAVSIILSDHNTGLTEYTYDMALVILDIYPLEVRRFKLCQKFAKQTLKSRHADMFQINQNQYNTRLKPEFVINKSNTERYFKSPINYLTRILNGEEEF